MFVTTLQTSRLSDGSRRLLTPLVYDASDGEWVLYDNDTEIARGNRFSGQDQPSVEEAMQLRKTARV